MNDASSNPLPLLGDADEALVDAAMAYLAGEMSDEQLDAFNRQLHDDAHAQQVVAALIWHRRMMIETLARGPASTTPITSTTPTLSPFRGRSVWYAAATIALLITGVTWFAMTSFTSPADNSTPQLSRPVALLTSSTGATWGGSTLPTALGSELAPGTLTLTAGSAQVMFNSGAVIDLVAPCDFELLDTQTGRLTHGQITAFVPQRARGFTVEAEGFAVVDWGTRFTMRVGMGLGEPSSVIVHEGQVEVRTAAQATMLSAAQAVRIHDGQVQLVNAGSLPTIAALLPGVARVKGNVMMLPTAPESVASRQRTDHDMAILFAERSNVLLEQPLAVRIDKPGAYIGDRLPGGIVKPGIHVDSYMLHFDPAGDGPETAGEVSGSITFKHPIRGLITNPGLADADSIFGSPTTVYDDFIHRGLEHEDELTLSPDRLTLQFKLSAFAVDQVRILIEHNNEDDALQGD
ncbi:hypothetical protein HED60_07870 [Planctomycetales bacterium ZRK34]|nr:hypothetical protein HED60_07870 [Planctomycetales bacterium ZRK34]